MIFPGATTVKDPDDGPVPFSVTVSASGLLGAAVGAVAVGAGAVVRAVVRTDVVAGTVVPGVAAVKEV